MPKSARLSRIKTLRCYTLQEAADITDVSTRTIRSWIGSGLPVMDAERPKLVRGDDLLAFLKNKRASRRTKIEPHEFYCLRCRTAKEAAGGLAERKVDGARLTLIALCNTCETVMCKPIAAGSLAALSEKLDLFEVT